MNFVNPTPFPTHVLRNYDDVPQLTLEVITKVTLDLAAQSLEIARAQSPLLDVGSPHAPNGETQPQLLQASPGVTIVGTLRAGGERFRRAKLRLQVGKQTRVLRVWGGRSWRRVGGRLVASEPSEVDAVPMDWSVALGGRYRVAPGFLPGTRIPAPSTEHAFAANPGGMGFYRHEAEAENQPLPQLEGGDAAIERWDDRPEPRCWAPLPSMSSLRMSTLVLDGDDLRGPGERTLQAEILSDVPHELRLAELVPAMEIVLTLDTGHAVRTLAQFALPEPPFQLTVSAGPRTSESEPSLERVQIHLDEAQVTLLYRTVSCEPLISGELRHATLMPRWPWASTLLGASP